MKSTEDKFQLSSAPGWIEMGFDIVAGIQNDSLQRGLGTGS